MILQSIELPTAFQCLFGPERYKILYGGRGGAKSWSIARVLAFMGAQRPIRWLCARETMSSLKESVHFLLEQQIKDMQLPGYHVEEARIWNDNGTEFTFCGLKNNAAGLKSYEGADGCWVEEAANVSKGSWDILIPTIRKAGSQIWVSFNPILETDDTYQRFVVNPPSSSVVVKVNWRDNPYFSEVLMIEKNDCKRKDPKNYAHIWEGECRSAVEGAVYGEEMRVAKASGRICSVPYDPTRPVETIWDLGFGDRTAIWFVQAVAGWYHFIDYLEDSGKTIEYYLIQLQNKNYVYGNTWLPHDALSLITHAKLGGGDRSRSIEGIMRAAGWRPRMIPVDYVVEGINAARTLFPLCRFDQEKCRDGLHALRMYQWGPVPASGVRKREPLHNDASHGADAFRGAATAVKQPKVEAPPKPKQTLPRVDRYAPFG